MCRTFEVNLPKPQLGLPQSQLSGKGNIGSQTSGSPFFLPVLYMGGNGYNAKQGAGQIKEEDGKDQASSLNKESSSNLQTPSVVSSMNPAEFPFPTVSSASTKSQPFEFTFMTEARQLVMPDGSMSKFLVIPYDEGMSLLSSSSVKTQPQEKAEPEPAVRYHPPITSTASSVKHRASCHRCGNLRKKNVLCSRCPHTFCQRCAEKMQEEHGPTVFENGCPVCKDLCCCGKNRTMQCPRKYHCYKKCPCTKRRAPHEQFNPTSSMLNPGNASFYPTVMNMMASPMNGLNTAYFGASSSLYDNGVSTEGNQFNQSTFKPSVQPDWPIPSDPQKAGVSKDMTPAKHGPATSGEDTTSSSDFEDPMDDKKDHPLKRMRLGDSPLGSTSEEDTPFAPEEQDALAALLEEDTPFYNAIQQLDTNYVQDTDLLGLSDDQLFDLLSVENLEF